MWFKAISLVDENGDEHKLKPARSQAELVRTRNSNLLLFIAINQLLINGAVALKVFGILP